MSSSNFNIDWAKPNAERASVHILLPNKTQLTIFGDTQVVAQIIKRLDGMEIVWEEKQL